MRDNHNFTSFKEFAYIAIAKHTKKILKYEAKVLKDQDPEDLHQMRVGMRRLRSAIAGFTVTLDLPPTVNEKNIAKIGRCLGKLRDLDVLLASLANNYDQLLPKKEQKTLEQVIKIIEKKRHKKVKQVIKILNSKLYLDFRDRIQAWIENPQYQKLGDIGIDYLLPDLLYPQISQLLLHSGWFVGVEVEKEQINLWEKLNEQEIEKLLEEKEFILHDLRKLAKKNRYNLELFSDLYDEVYQYYVTQIEQIQEVLGQIQDCYVLKTTLEKILQSTLVEKMPTLASILTQTRYQKWQEWQILQEEFLDLKSRQEFRQTIQQSIINI